MTPRAWKILIVSSLVSIASVAYAFRKPARVQVQEKVVEKVVTKEVVKWKTRVVEHRDVHRDVTTVVKPDGTHETHVVTDSHAARDSASSGASSDSKVQNSTVTASESVASQPRWMVGVTSSHTLGTPGLTWGGEGKVRVLGPFWLGVQAEPTEKRVGASLSVAW